MTRCWRHGSGPLSAFSDDGRPLLPLEGGKTATRIRNQRSVPWTIPISDDEILLRSRLERELAASHDP